MTWLASCDTMTFVFFLPGARNYLLRPGQHWGLAAIGMLDQGIIWNQHLDSFRKNRECFQNALRSSELTRGTSLARKATCRWISTFSLQWEEAGLEPLQNHRQTGLACQF